MQLQKRSTLSILKIPLLIFIGVVLIGAVVVFGLFHIRMVDVVGNEFYSAEEIQQMVMSDSMAENSIYLTWKYSGEKSASSLPFLSAVEVSMISPYHVQIRVYEKTIVGYLMYSGSRVYFDIDGSVVEMSGEEREGIPPFSGIALGQPVVGAKLPVEDEKFLDEIVEASRLIHQSGLAPDEVHFDENRQIILYFGLQRVLLGDDSYLEEKLMELAEICPKMEGLSGTLHMETYTPDTTTFRFLKGERGSEEEELIIDIGSMVEESEAQAQEDADQQTANAEGGGYEDRDSRFSTDAAGNQIYTDDAGNVTTNLEKQYLSENGEIISDGYGYIDPYTGAYILN